MNAQPHNFISLYAAGSPMMDQKDGSEQELLGLYYITLALSKEGSTYALPDKLDQLFRQGEYASLPSFDDDYSTEEQKIKYYACTAAGSATLRAETKAACDDVLGS